MNSEVDHLSLSSLDEEFYKELDNEIIEMEHGKEKLKIVQKFSLNSPTIKKNEGSLYREKQLIDHIISLKDTIKKLKQDNHTLRDKMKNIKRQNKDIIEKYKKDVNFEMELDFKDKNTSLHEMFIKEHQKVLDQFNTKRDEIIRKNKAIKKLVNILVSQETSLSEAYINANTAIGETISTFRSQALPKKKGLQEKIQIDLTTQTHRFIRDVEVNVDIPGLNKATAYGEDCSQALKYMEFEFDTLKHLSETLMDDFSTATFQKKSLQKKFREMKCDYEAQIKEKNAKIKALKKQVRDILIAKEKEFRNLKKCVNSEFDIKDIIIQRHQEYSKILMKELVFSKNIIKNPKLLSTASNFLNYQAENLGERVKKLPEKYRYPAELNRKARSPEGRVVPLKLNKIKRSVNFFSISPRSRNQNSSAGTSTTNLQVRSYRENKQPMMNFRPPNFTARKLMK
ncbi:unnamed protein product [Moneuplotes crassus]|uniref:Uncharacterized protein n=1 Tax=Euplotes crassus TaxID=5936 RepID=A0AAD1XBT0_EUPCR|nr:unnamed protein product [Moneuplotes crassus]